MLTFLLTISALAGGGDGSEIAIRYGTCVHCHGAHGEGRPELGTPRLGDLEPAYIAIQLQAMREGTRGGHPDDAAAKPMVAMAKGLPREELVSELAVYAAALKPEHRDAGEPVEGGRAAYASCVQCHGADADGKPEVGAPSLLFQDSSYLVRQLQNYRDGKRGAEGSPAFAQQMATQARGLTDEEIERVVAHIASLRPERPPLEQYPVSLSEEEGLQAFEGIYAAVTHPRCLNCHPEGDAPLHTDQSIPHDFGIDRFSPLDGVHCSTCHAAASVGDGQAPLPPSDPIWSMAPAQMVFENRTPAQICAQLKDPAINGGRGHVGSTAHIAEDHLLQTSWHMGRTPPPVSHEELVQLFETWGRAGGPCPEAQAPGSTD